MRIDAILPDNIVRVLQMSTVLAPRASHSIACLCYDRASVYPIDARIDDLVDGAVASCWEQGESLDATIDLVAALVRTAAPTDLVETDPEWESRWRKYFAFYDHALMHGIRAYVARANGLSA